MSELILRPGRFTRKPQGPLEVVHCNDMLSVLPLNCNLTQGPWIAGGAALSWYQNKPIGKSDIDVFCRTEKQYDTLYKLLTSGKPSDTTTSSLVYKSDNAVSFDVYQNGINQVWKVQLIKKLFNSVEDLISNFDITVCQVVTDGHRFVLGQDTAYHINNKILSFTKFNTNTVKRLVKYWAYGFEPESNTLDAIYSNTEISWNFINSDEYDNAF